ncbi:hypothetical protein FRX31_030789 [Thalictrum thalictroides]|uniref:Uncharacterized protein n=1 Tax=Thalictrum thalictroides TaxID=46969 RepID=A0A7J6V3U6_THATH|nr:hypothetical protein FRX31_030789 [Thalictrum thalictroides]
MVVEGVEGDVAVREVVESNSWEGDVIIQQGNGGGDREEQRWGVIKVQKLVVMEEMTSIMVAVIWTILEKLILVTDR